MQGSIKNNRGDEIDLGQEKCMIGITVDENGMMRKVAMGVMTINETSRVMYMLREAARELEAQISHRLYSLGRHGNETARDVTLSFSGDLSGGHR